VEATDLWDCVEMVVINGGATARSREPGSMTCRWRLGGDMRLAVIGSGISGLGAAWLTARRHEVHLFEARDRLGGHTHTVSIEDGGRPLRLDTGFIVFNHATYPNLTRLFRQLGVEERPSDMSFGISCRIPDLEYAVSGLGALFAQRRNLFSPRFLGMVLDIMRFGPRARAALEQAPDPGATVSDFLRDEGFGEDFAKFYLLPMTGAIWSSGSDVTAGFPRDALFRFYANHGLLQVTGQPQWYTLADGSSSYVPHLTRPLGDRVHLGAAVTRIVRGADEVTLHFEGGHSDRFDGVVIATHADQALRLLDSPTDAERELLGAWRYSSNDTWLHTDTRLMPRRRAAWASWNYLIEDADQPSGPVSVSYHLNRLQRLDVDREFIVTLNPTTPPASEHVLRRMTYRHPVYTSDAVTTQRDLPSLNGRLRTWFCGAYFRNGFHEDGFDSAIAVADDLGIQF